MGFTCTAKQLHLQKVGERNRLDGLRVSEGDSVRWLRGLVRALQRDLLRGTSLHRLLDGVVLLHTSNVPNAALRREHVLEANLKQV